MRVTFFIKGKQYNGTVEYEDYATQSYTIEIDGFPYIRKVMKVADCQPL